MRYAHVSFKMDTTSDAVDPDNYSTALYTFRCVVPDVEPGDFVLVETQNGLQVVLVRALSDKRASGYSGPVSRHVIQKVDFAAWRQAVLDDTAREQKLSELKQRLALQDMNVRLKALVQVDPEAAALVKELQAQGGTLDGEDLKVLFGDVPQASADNGRV